MFKLPKFSDDDLSEGHDLSVKSLRPEDLPHFETDWSHTLAGSQKLERVDTACALAAEFNPDWNGVMEDMQTIALSRRPVIHFFSMTVGGTELISAAILLKPSLRITPGQRLANETLLLTEDIIGQPLDTDTYEAMAIGEAFGKYDLLNNPEGLNFGTAERSIFWNLNAERAGHAFYESLGGTQEAIETAIQERALAGFLADPAERWVSSSLTGAFNSMVVSLTQVEMAVRANLELCVRATEAAIGAGLSTIDSDDLQAGLTAYREADIHPEPLSRPAQAFSRMNSIRYAMDPVSTYDIRKAMLRHLPAIVDHPATGAQAAASGRQVLEAAKRFCPKLLG